MNKAFLALCALLLAGLLTACNQLTQYTISEQEINQALQKHNNYQKDIGVSGLINAHIVLNNLSSQIGREEPGKVTLSGNAKVNITSLLGPQQADMQLKMKALPFFDKEKGAIFLKDLEIVDADVQPEKMQSILQTLTPYLNQSLKSYFDRQPAYVLSEDRSKAEALAKKLAKGIEVKPGELVIPFTD
ncbi:MAG: lipoprotein [Pantoea sp.]|nr:lipoprotein [Pantoea sp.]